MNKMNQKRKVLYGVYIVILAMMMFAVMQPVAAWPKVKMVQICHFDSNTGLFQKINIPVGSYDFHMNHGDKEAPKLGYCNEKPWRFAIAYIDRNKSHQYEEGEDIPIAELVDAFRDGRLGNQDKIYTTRYPIEFDPRLGYYDQPFNQKTHEVYSGSFVTPSYVIVEDSAGGRFFWVIEKNSHGYMECTSFPRYCSIMHDYSHLFGYHYPVPEDRLHYDHRSPSMPADTWLKRRSGTVAYADDFFIDVEITPHPTGVVE